MGDFRWNIELFNYCKMKLSISLNEQETKVLQKRAKKNLLTLKEQVEDIVRRSCISCGTGTTTSVKVDDALVAVFSRQKKGKKN